MFYHCNVLVRWRYNESKIIGQVWNDIYPSIKKRNKEYKNKNTESTKTHNLM